MNSDTAFDTKDRLPEAALADIEAVRLVIWDLDDTFWTGTLSEGGITPIESNIALVKDLAGRGIVSSICSKNHFNEAKASLEALGIWDYFIFPEIEFAPKGAMIKRIIENIQLRAKTVLFIDDNHLNLNEALHYNPGLQVALPKIIPAIADDWRFIGKSDPELTRLNRYKVLEEKQVEQKKSGGDNVEFLRNSDIKVSFHHDIDAEFVRIHDLVNRSNQLNFTKRRWSEDLELAKQEFQNELKQNFNSSTGYIKVADRYGNYGICGFYLVSGNRAMHFLFSCRAMSMGVEQFIWNRLGCPKVDIIGEVVAALNFSPDWIQVVDDVDKDDNKLDDSGPKPRICIRGACDLSMMSHYLRTKFDLMEEFPFPYKGWGIHPVARVIAMNELANTDVGRDLVSKMPGIPEGYFNSSIHAGEADVFILSFSSELFPKMYRSRSTGLIFPFHNKDFRTQILRKSNILTYWQKRIIAPNFQKMIGIL